MEIVKKSLKLYALCIAGSIMCLVLTATMNLIGANIFGQQVGYNMQGTIEEDESEYKQLYTYFYDDGEDLQKAKYEADGYKLKEVPIKTPTVGWNVCAQICLFFMMGVFVFNNLWNIGFKDHNAVRIGTVKEDKFKGLKIGFLVALPSIILFTVLLIGRNSFASKISVATFSFLNPYIERAAYLIANSVRGAYISELGLWKIVGIFLLMLFIPLVATVAYILGYKSIIISEKLIYKKNQEN